MPREPQRDQICAIRTAATKTLAGMGIDLKKEDPLRGTLYGHTGAIKSELMEQGNKKRLAVTSRNLWGKLAI